MWRLNYLLAFFFFLLINIVRVHAQQFDWLIGKYKISKDNTIIYELWTKQNDTTYTAKSFTVNKTDTTFDETVELKKQNDNWFYIVTTTQQNNQKPVAFKLIFIGKNEFIATNPKHDFPQRIAYRLIENKMLYASIEGQMNKKYKKGNYDFLKIIH